MESTDAEFTGTPDDPARALSTAALIADTSGALLGAVFQIDRLHARQSAWKAEFIDQARQIALLTEDAVITVGTNHMPAQRQDLARRAFVADVACELRIPERSAIALIDESEALMHRLPRTLAALRAGSISYRHAQALIDQTSTFDPDAAAQLEELSLPHAQTLTPARFTQKVRVLRERLRPESAVARREKGASDRRVEYLPAPDGMAWLNLYTTAPVDGSLFTAIRTQSVSLQGPGEARTLAELDADVCADAMLTTLLGGEEQTPAPSPSPSPSVTGSALARRAGAGSEVGAEVGAAFRKIKPTVVVTVPMLGLIGRSDEPATLDGYGPIDLETARALLAQASSFTRVLTDPESGAAISWGTKRYKPTKRMRAFLRYRDQRCRFPGCNRAAEFCDVDHTSAWQFGGPTHLENLALLCPKHHRLKHETTWNVEQRGGGVLAWTSPNGRRYVTTPENAVRPFGVGPQLDPSTIPEARGLGQPNDTPPQSMTNPAAPPTSPGPSGSRSDPPPF